MSTPSVVDEEGFDVGRVAARGGPAGAAAAFLELERRLDSLRGRRTYGVVTFTDPPSYFACLRLRDGEDDLGLERAWVPGGLYGRRVVRDWSNRIEELPSLVDALASDLAAAGFAHDRTRPLVEDYRRHDELVLKLPVRRAP